MRQGSTGFLFPALLLVFFFSTELTAQTTVSGGLTGVVTDPSHAVVPGADVEIQDSAKGTTQSTKTDREGVYRFFLLAALVDFARAERNTFATYLRERHRQYGLERRFPQYTFWARRTQYPSAPNCKLSAIGIGSNAVRNEA